MTTTAPEVVTPGSGERVRRLRGGLRRRILLIFTLGSAVLALLLAGATYALTRSNVVQQTENAGIEATRRNARTVQNNLRGPTPSAQPAIDALESLGVQRALIWSNDQCGPRATGTSRARSPRPSSTGSSTTSYRPG